MGTVKHAKVSLIPDGTDTDLVRPSDWNADHVLALDKADVGLGNVDNTSDADKPISTATQTALNGKLAVSHEGSGGSTRHPNATTSVSGFMSAADKAKLNGIATGAQTGTVTSVALSGGTTGISVSGSPITTSGTFTLSGTLTLSNGGTGATTAAGARTNLGLGTLATLSTINNSNWSGTALAVANGGTGQSTYTNGQLLIGNSTGNTLTKATLTAGSGITITNGAGIITISSSAGSGTVTSVNVSGGTTGLTTSGGPITTSGTITLAGTLAVANGGTGATTAAGARTNLGLGTLATLSTINNSNWSGTALAVANGGTGSTTAAGARTNLNAASLAANTYTGNQTAPDFISTSDETLKYNIRPLLLPEGRIPEPVRFQWKSTGICDIGFIAQRVQKEYPEAVFEDEKGILGVSYGRLVAVLAAKIIELEARLASLEAGHASSHVG